MKRILLFSLSYYPRVSGAEIAVKEITDRISPADIQFCMVTQRFSKMDVAEEQIGNVRVYRVGAGGSYLSKILFIPRAARMAYRIHKEKKFDALWALMSYMVLPIMLLRMSGLRLPYVLTLQDGDPFAHVFSRPHIRPFKGLLVKGFREAAVVHVISNYLASWTQTIGYRGPVEVIPNGVDLSLFTKHIPSKEVVAKKQKVGKLEGDVWLVHTGRLVKKNSLDTVIRALPLLSKNIHFLLVGDGVEKISLRNLSVALQVAQRVHFVGSVNNHELPQYLAASDIFIRPSVTEGLGISFLEAMAIGLPVVATQEGGIADFIFDAKRNPEKQPTGFAVNVESQEQIAQAVEEILTNPDQTRKVISNAQALVKQKYDWDLIAKDMRVRVFGKVLKTD